MRRFKTLSWKKIALVAVLTAFQIVPMGVFARSPIQTKDFAGAIDLDAEGPAPFVLKGYNPLLGRYQCSGEVQFFPGEAKGSLVGEGVAVFEAANGDLLVGDVTWEVQPGGDLRTSRINFSWRDSVDFSDGTRVPSTGVFEEDKPQALVVIAIIAILIGLLLPAVQ